MFIVYVQAHVNFSTRITLKIWFKGEEFNQRSNKVKKTHTKQEVKEAGATACAEAKGDGKQMCN